VKEEEHVPPTLPPDQHAAFVDQDVAAFVEVLAKPLFNYRMARGQLSRPGYPKRLREYEKQLRALKTARFRFRIVTSEGEELHRDTLVAQDGDTLTVTLRIPED
jgi:hypothetical protein